jgi:hypothetical protein
MYQLVDRHICSSLSRAGQLKQLVLFSNLRSHTACLGAIEAGLLKCAQHCQISSASGCAGAACCCPSSGCSGWLCRPCVACNLPFDGCSCVVHSAPPFCASLPLFWRLRSKSCGRRFALRLAACVSACIAEAACTAAAAAEPPLLAGAAAPCPSPNHQQPLHVIQVKNQSGR